jgi:hypothetical protein
MANKRLLLQYLRKKYPIKGPSTKIVDMIGLRFGRLVVVAAEPSDKSGAAMWGCVCDCRGVGGEWVFGAGKAIVRGASLRSGATLSCGCIAREATVQRAKDKPKLDPALREAKNQENPATRLRRRPGSACHRR